MSLLAIQLILAHIIGDFVLQPTHWIADKNQRSFRSRYLYGHIGVHAGLLLLILQFDFRYWLAMVVIIVSHYVIDVTKILIDRGRNKVSIFVIDQLAHFLIIAWVVYFYEPFEVNFQTFLSPATMLLVLAILLVTVVTSIIMKIILSRWNLEEDDTEDSLENAGKYIGILERLFVFGFIIMQQWQAIGFLIAAKSVFRFGDLSRSKDRKLTEYILIGTLMSFGFAILIGIAYLRVMELISDK